MMLLDVVDRLLGLEAELVVTITAPLDRRRAGNDEDRIRIRTCSPTHGPKCWRPIRTIRGRCWIGSTRPR
jgi:hypothetical protein